MAGKLESLAKHVDSTLRDVRTTAKEVSKWSTDVSLAYGQLGEQNGCRDEGISGLIRCSKFVYSLEGAKTVSLAIASYPTRLFSDLTVWATSKLIAKN